MAQEINDKILIIPSSLMSQITVVDAAVGTEQTGLPNVAGAYRAARGTLHTGTLNLDVPGAMTIGQWTVVPGPNAGELIWRITALPPRNGKPITKFQRALDADLSPPSWVDLPTGTSTGDYVVTGLPPGTLYTALGVRAVNAIGGALVSDLKSATVTDDPAVNIITNSGFDSGTGWFLSDTSTTSIAGGKLIFNNADNPDRCTQTGLNVGGSPVPAGTYNCAITISDYVSGSVAFRLRDSTNVIVGASASQTGNGLKTFQVTASGPFVRLDIYSVVTGTTMSLDDVLVEAA